MKRKKDLKLEITELFMAKAGKKGWDRCFHGTINRDIDEYGNPIVYGKIKINEGYIYAMASDQWILGEMLDDLVLMILDAGIHINVGKTITIGEVKFFLN